MAAKTQISHAFPFQCRKKCILLFHWLYDSLQPMRSLAAADWLSMFAAERNRAGNGHKLALVFGSTLSSCGHSTKAVIQTHKSINE